MSPPFDSNDEIKQYPVAILEDRYGGVYSGGAWIALAGVTARSFRGLLDGAHGDDCTAAQFGSKIAQAPDIAVGKTPQEALKNLRAKLGSISSGGKP